MIVWFDMDGVLANFDGEYVRLTGCPPWYQDPNSTADQKWERINNFPNFFRDLPWMDGARAMWNFVHFSRVGTSAILSAASSHVRQSKYQKLEWLGREVPETTQI